MSLQARSRKRYLYAGGLLVLIAILSALLLSSRIEAAPEQQAATGFSVLEPATAGRLQALPDETERTLHSISTTGIRGDGEAQSVTQLGVALTADGDEMTVAAVGDGLCVLRAADAACGESRDVFAGRLFGARPRGCGSYWVFGLVPDGVDRVLVDTGADGSVDSSLPVVGNVYEGTLVAAATVALGVDASGETLFRTDIPLDYYAATNGACGG